VSRYQKGKINLDFTEARDSEWQWHQVGHMQVCTSLQTDNHASTPPLSFFTGRMPFLPPNQQRQSTLVCWPQNNIRQLCCLSYLLGFPPTMTMLTPLEKMDEKLKSENMQKEQFSERG